MGLMGRKRHDRPRRGVIWVRAAGPAGLVVLLAACGSSGSSSSASGAASSASPAATVTVSSAPPSAVTSSSFVNIVEPFDPGHPARVRTGPASCGTQSSTLAIEQCYEIKTENTDAAIDAVQSAKFKSAQMAQQNTILAQDRAWLAARQPVCAAAFHTGGTIDKISVASCLLAESTARLDAVKGITPPVVKLKGTDSTDPNQLDWYTTPEGSRIAEISTQGDQTGGAVIAWVIVGGADGFIVNPKQFYFADGSFTDPGVVQPPNPTSHRVATGQQYQFGIDYSKLSKDPNANKSAAGYVYAPGAPAAIWGG
jgi:uncharacterized protein YecT (DUF1311 family)